MAGGSCEHLFAFKYLEWINKNVHFINCRGRAMGVTVSKLFFE